MFALKTLAAALGALVLATFATQTIERNRLWSDREAFLRDAIEKEPLYHRPYCNLGHVTVLNGGSYDKAMALFKECNELREGGSFQAVTKMVELALDRQRFDEAKEYVLHSCPPSVKSSVCLNLWAMYYSASGDLKQAESILKELLEKEPDKGEFKARLANVLYSEGNLKQAKKLYLEAIALGGGSNMTRLWYLRTELKLGNPQKVIDEVGHIKPQNAIERYMKTELEAHTYFALGKLKLADAALVKLITMNPTKSEAIKSRAKIAYLLGDSDSAQNLLEQALEVTPNDAEAIHLLKELMQRKK